MISSKRTIKSMTALFVAMSFAFAGNALVVSSVGIILKKSSVGELMIGAINAVFFIGAMISTLSSQKFISKIGHIRSFGLFSAVFAICIILHSVSENLYFWLILRFLLGFCYYGLLVLIESWINEKAKNAVRSRVLSFYEIVFYISFGTGILIIGLDLDKNLIFIIAACLIMFSSVPLNLLKIKAPILPPNSKISLPKFFGIAPLALVGSFIGGMVMNGFFSMASVFILVQNFSVADFSYFMFCGMVGGFLGQSIIGSISDKFGRKFAIIITAFIALLGSIGFLFFNSIFMLCVLSVILGSGIFCLYALSLARANDMLEDKTKRVELGRAVLFMYSIGSFIAPLFLGFLMQIFGKNGFIWFYIVNLGFLIIFATNKPNKKSTTSTKSLKNFITE